MRNEGFLLSERYICPIISTAVRSVYYYLNRTLY